MIKHSRPARPSASSTHSERSLLELRTRAKLSIGPSHLRETSFVSETSPSDSPISVADRTTIGPSQHSIGHKRKRSIDEDITSTPSASFQFRSSLQFTPALRSQFSQIALRNRSNHSSRVAYLKRQCLDHHAFREADRPRFTYRDFKLGTIIQGPFLIPNGANGDKSVGPGHSAHSQSSIVGNLIAKFRPMVVLAIFEKHMLCLPFYTCGNKGLNNAPDRRRYESLILQNDDEPNFPGIHDSFIVKVKTGTNSGWRVKENATCHAIFPIAIQYGYPISILGEIDYENWTKLSAYFQTLLGEGLAGYAGEKPHVGHHPPRRIMGNERVWSHDRTRYR